VNPRVLVLTLSSFAFGSGALIFSGLLEFLAADLGVSAGAAGQIQTTPMC
jgi:DHA1 family inner membrane transport protein